MNLLTPEVRNVHTIALGFFWVMVGLAVAYGAAEVIFYLWVDYPFNKYEPEVALEAWRLSNGEPIYTPLDSGPYAGLYAPLFQLFGGFLYLILPESLTLLRAISIGSLALIVYFGWKLSPQQSRLQLLFAAVLIVIWHNRVVQFDMHAKPDSFAIMLGVAALMALVIAHKHLSRTGWLWAAVLTSLAFAAKQPMLLFAAGIGVAFLLHARWKEAFLYGFSFLGITAVLWWILALLSGDEILFYTIVQPGGFEISMGRLGGTALSILSNFWFPLAVILMLRRWINHRWSFSDTLLLSTLIFAYPASILTAAKGGGLSNGYMPFYYVMTLIILRNLQIETLFRGLLLQRFNTRQVLGWRSALAIYLGIAIFLTLSINPASYITSWQHRATAHQNYERLAEFLEQQEGRIYAPMDNYITLKAGRPWYWSAKSEMDLGAVKPDIVRRYRQYALEADITVSVDWQDWYDAHAMEEHLRRNGFEQIFEAPMEQGVKYRVWQQQE